MNSERKETSMHGNGPLPQGAPPDADVGLDFRYYAQVIWNFKWLILFCVIISIGLAALQLRRSPVVYSSTAQIKFEPQGAQVVDFGERSSILYQRDEIRTAVELVKSPAVAERVLEALGSKPPQPVQDESPISKGRRAVKEWLRHGRQFFVSKTPEQVPASQLAEQTQVENLLRGLRVTQHGDTKLINVTYSGSQQELTAVIANEFCEQFINYLNDDKMQAVGYARTFLNDQVEVAKRKLREAEIALYAYSGQSSDLSVLDENLRIAISTMTTLTNEMEKEKNSIALLEAENRALAEEPVRPTIFNDDEMISSLVRRLTDLQIEKLSMEAVNQKDFPDLQRIDREMAGIQKELDKLTVQMNDHSATKLRMARYRLESLGDRLKEQRAKVEELEEQMIDYRALEREVESAREIYSSLLDQYKRIEVKDDLTPSNVTITHPAPVPTVPTSPKVTRTLMVFTIFGSFFGIALSLFLNWADRSVKDPVAVEERLGLPTLGYVPYIKQKKRLLKGERGPAVAGEGTSGAVAEAFHYLRTSLQYSSAEHPPQVILITSCLPKEGKSTVSSNLAKYFAERGKRTLLIDADLKRPTIHKAFGVSRMPGLSDILTGQASLETTVVATDQEHLDVLPAGVQVPSPVNLLESQAMTELINKLRGQYATIILDSAPAFGMADSLVLSTKVDGVCLVVRTGKTLTEILEKTSGKIHLVGARLLGVVYNSGREKRLDKSYGYGSVYTYAYDARAEKPPIPTAK